MLGLPSMFGETMEAETEMTVMEQTNNSSGWYVVNDGVMGGISQSRAEMTDGKNLRFTGVLSLENNGGFASIRHDAAFFGIGHGDGIRMRVKGDGNKYQLRVRTSNRFDGIAYKAEFVTIKDVWQDLKIPWERFSATYRGRAVKGAPKLQGDQIQQVGFMIADKQQGGFEMEVAYLGALNMEE